MATKSNPINEHRARMGLLAHWEAATPEQLRDGRDWYKHALLAATNMAIQHHVSVRTAAGVIAILSPQHTWAQNLKLAEECLGRQELKCFKAMAKRACDFRDNEGPITGPKVSSFFAAIMGHEQEVVIDRWMLRAAGLPDKLRLTPKRYEYFAELLRDVAEEVCVSPAVLQATVWCVVRGKSF